MTTLVGAGRLAAATLPKTLPKTARRPYRVRMDCERGADRGTFLASGKPPIRPQDLLHGRARTAHFLSECWALGLAQIEGKRECMFGRGSRGSTASTAGEPDWR